MNSKGFAGTNYDSGVQTNLWPTCMEIQAQFWDQTKAPCGTDRNTIGHMHSWASGYVHYDFDIQIDLRSTCMEIWAQLWTR